MDELREFVRLQALDVSLALDYFSEEGQNYRYLSGMIENYLWFYAEGDDAWLDSVTYANKTIKELEEAAAIASTEELKPTNEELLLLEELYYTEWAALDPSKKADYRYVVQKVTDYMKAINLNWKEAIEFTAKTLGRGQA